MPNPPALRAWLVRKLKASGDSALDQVNIEKHFTGDRKLLPMMVFTGRFRPDGGTGVREMRAGPKGYQHLVAMDVIIQVRRAKDLDSNETQAMAIYNALAGVVASNVVPYDEDGVTPLAYSAVLGDWTLETGFTDTGSATELVTSIRFHIDS